MHWIKERISLIIGLLWLGCVVGFLWINNNDKNINKPYFEGEINKFCINENCVEKDGDRWWLRIGEIKQPALKETTENYVKKLSQLTIGKVVSDNKSKESLYGFSEPKVKITVNSKSIILGKIDTNYTFSYVKLPESDKVYQTNLILDNKSFADMTVIKIEPDKIFEIKATNGIKETKINIKDKVFVEKIANLTGIKYLPSIDIQKAKAVKIIINNGEYNLIIGQIDKIYFATANEKDYFEIESKDYFALRAKIR